MKLRVPESILIEDFWHLVDPGETVPINLANAPVRLRVHVLSQPIWVA